MSNYSVMDANFNLTSILSTDLINSPNSYALAFNSEMGGILFISLLVVIGIVLFIGTKNSGVVSSDTEALSFAGIVTSFLGVLFFVLRLVEWLWLVPILLITGIAIYMNFTNRQF